MNFPSSEYFAFRIPRAINIIGRIINNNNNSARHGSTKEDDARLGTRASELKSDG